MGGHLKKDPVTGHLLRNKNGHLVKECAPTTTTTEAPTTTTPAPTTTTTPAPTTTTQAPGPCDCGGDCPQTVYADITSTCNGGCSGTYSWSMSLDCTWTGGLEPCDYSDIHCEEGTASWKVSVPSLDLFQYCSYSKAASAGSCPTGTYSLSSSDGCTCDSEINVYS